MKIAQNLLLGGVFLSIVACDPITKTPENLSQELPFSIEELTATPLELDIASIEDPIITKALLAIRDDDIMAQESIRDVIKEKHVAEIASYWNQKFSWKIKNGFVTVLMDQLDDSTKPLMTDALKSPSVETRAYAICILTKNFEQFTSFLTSSGKVDATKVQAAISKFQE